MPPTAVVPTGAEHGFSADEIFFSTTDARGVITQANSVFVRLSHHPRSELVGAPHNVIRHPDMPGGAFKLVWDTLEAGRPVCAYTKNLAANGSASWVFATITPLDDGYLSVRSKPIRDDLRSAVAEMYDEARAVERAARAHEGLSAAAAAERGLAVLAARVGAAGFASYQDFMEYALPAEVLGLAAASSGFPSRPGAGGDLAAVLGLAADVDRELDSLVGRLDGYREQAEVLTDAVDRTEAITGELGRSVEAAERAAEQVGDRLPVFANTTRMIRKQASLAQSELGGLARALGELGRGVCDLRFRIALAKLQNDQLGAFLVELIDGVPDLEAARPAMGPLSRAVEEGVVAATDALADVQRRTAQLADDLSASREALRLAQSLLGTWRMLVGRYRISGQLSDLLPQVEQQVEAGTRALGELDALARKLGATRLGHDTERVREGVRGLRAQVAVLVD